MITKTSLTHPTMMAKIHLAIKLAKAGDGDQMNGHKNRCYIQDRKGRNIMRLDYRNDDIIVYGSESRNITSIVKAAIKQYFYTNILKSNKHV